VHYSTIGEGFPPAAQDGDSPGPPKVDDAPFSPPLTAFSVSGRPPASQQPACRWRLTLLGGHLVGPAVADASDASARRRKSLRERMRCCSAARRVSRTSSERGPASDGAMAPGTVSDDGEKAASSCGCSTRGGTSARCSPTGLTHGTASRPTASHRWDLLPRRAGGWPVVGCGHSLDACAERRRHKLGGFGKQRSRGGTCTPALEERPH
jgi:hypothetical protein